MIGVKELDDDIEFLTIDEVCSWLKISRKTLERYRKEDGLKYVKVGKSIRFTKKDVLDWINMSN
jgi:excisionase family DNA binding protein